MFFRGIKQDPAGRYFLHICPLLLFFSGEKHEGHRLNLLSDFCFSSSPADKVNTSNSSGFCRLSAYVHRCKEGRAFKKNASGLYPSVIPLCRLSVISVWQRLLHVCFALHINWIHRRSIRKHMNDMSHLNQPINIFFGYLKPVWKYYLTTNRLAQTPLTFK